MSKRTYINKKLVDVETTMIRAYSGSSVSGGTDFCKLFNTYKSIDGRFESWDDIWEYNTTYPKNIFKIMYMPFAQTKYNNVTNSSDSYSLGATNPSAICYLSAGVHPNLRLVWNAYPSITSKLIYKSYKNKVALKINLRVRGSTTSNVITTLDRLYVLIGIEDLYRGGQSAPIILKGCYLCPNSYNSESGYFKPTSVEITGYDLKNLTGETIPNPSTLLSELKTIPIAVSLVSTSYHRDNAETESSYTDNYAIPTNTFEDKPVNLRLHYFSIEMPKQFCVHDHKQQSTLPSKVEDRIDLDRMFTVPSPIKFEMGAISDNDTFMSNYHSNLGYENELSVSTNDFGDLEVVMGEALYPTQAAVENATATEMLHTNYMYADFINHCLANTRIEVSGVKNNSPKQLSTCSAYSFMTTGIVVDNLNQYSHLTFRIWLPDLGWIRNAGATGAQTGMPIGRYMLYNIKMQIGGYIDDERSSVQSMSRGILLGTKRVQRMFIDGKEVEYFVADTEE